MRKTVLFLILATSAVPAIAADDPDDRSARREAARAERAERAEARAQRQAERQQPSERSEPAAPMRPVERRGDDRPEIREMARPAIEQRRVDRPERNYGGDVAPAAIEPRLIERRPGPRPERRALEERMVEPPAERSPGAKMVRPTLEQRREAMDSVREWRRAEREELQASRPAVIEQRTDSGWESLRERRREVSGRDGMGNRRSPFASRATIVSRVPLEGTQPPLPAAARPSSLTARHWRGDWRSDHRYDWRRHRNRFRWLFQLGFYHDPFGWRYRPYSIGWRMWPGYYRSSYWLNDPWRYRLPYAPAGYRWIRYYDDALLVDTWDGTVVDVIHGFFW